MLSNNHHAQKSHTPETKEPQYKERHKYHLRQPLTLDYGLIKEWLRTCDVLHDCSEPTEDPILILAIDCHSMGIVEMGSNEKYSALSYVWGNVEALRLTDALLNKLRSPFALERLGPLSKTIDDAIRFVRNIGQRYLWVDRLCIIQDNETHATRAINMMHEVYAHAWAVIIAGSGEDSNAGLPRVPIDDGVSAPQWSNEMEGCSNETLPRTCYETRAWT